MLKKVGINMTVERYAVGASLFDELLECAELSPSLLEPLSEEDGERAQVDRMEMFCEGRLRVTEQEFSLSYEESELTGMEGTSSQLSFRLDHRELLTMLRSGSVSTALVFEQGKRHICVYQTPYMPFEVCVHTLKVDNRLTPALTDAVLELDYVIEIRGAQAERCRMRLEVREQ